MGVLLKTSDDCLGDPSYRPACSAIRSGRFDSLPRFSMQLRQSFLFLLSRRMFGSLAGAVHGHHLFADAGHYLVVRRHFDRWRSVFPFWCTGACICSGGCANKTWGGSVLQSGRCYWGRAFCPNMRCFISPLGLSLTSLIDKRKHARPSSAQKARAFIGDCRIGVCAAHDLERRK